MTKKFLAMLLAVVMVVSMLPNVFAAAAVCPGEGEIHSKDNCTNYKKADEEPVAPGCCTPGYTLYVCEDCGEHFASDIIVATEADDCTFKKVSEYVAPDCLNAGALTGTVNQSGTIVGRLDKTDSKLALNGVYGVSEFLETAIGKQDGSLTDSDYEVKVKSELYGTGAAKLSFYTEGATDKYWIAQDGKIPMLKSFEVWAASLAK